MNQELIEYIKDLSKKDKKTLSQKALKVSEEVGELARIVLPFDNASGTNHRFVEKTKILEECADIILTAMSIPLEEGFDYDDLESMIRHKANKWHSIQQKESKAEYPLPFEMHVTIKRPSDIEKFVIDCKETLNVKPIVLDLQNDGEVVMQDVMTSSHYYGTNGDAYLEVQMLSEKLSELGYEVIRKKIESVPWHPMAPSEGSHITEMPANCYFEAHIRVVVEQKDNAILHAVTVYNNAHLSKNTFKKNSDGTYVIMVTLRGKRGTFEEFNKRLEKLKKALDYNKFSYEKVITEFAIYDTNVSHDFLWLSKKVSKKETK